MTNWEQDLPRTAAEVHAGMAAQLHIGAQLYVVRDGQTVADGAIGLARPESAETPAMAMMPDTLMLWLSSSKPVAAVAIMQLCEASVLRLDDPAAKHIEAFAANGKEAVTIRHLLTHTGGFRFIDVGDATTPWDEIIRRLCVARLERNWVPGERAGYHPYTSWYVLAELVARASGISFSRYVRERIFEPLAMGDCRIGMPYDVQAAYGDRLGVIVNTERREENVAPSLAPHPLSRPDGLASCVPGANGCGPVRQLAHLYEAFLGGGERRGVRILSAESVATMTSRQRVGMFDETFKHTLDWGLGVIPNNRRYGIDTIPYGYGRHASDEAFGHSGSQSSVAFTDPTHKIVVAVVFNGTCGERAHQPRMRAVLDAIYEDIGITRDD